FIGNDANKIEVCNYFRKGDNIYFTIRKFTDILKESNKQQTLFDIPTNFSFATKINYKSC
ncbi:MAG: hypothetical protein LBB45_06530, partial [Methanobrevibacter sp.]|nr:hypothetical protein [Candidatus Methanovirga basalitermitum]